MLIIIVSRNNFPKQKKNYWIILENSNDVDTNVSDFSYIFKSAQSWRFISNFYFLFNEILRIGKRNYVLKIRMVEKGYDIFNVTNQCILAHL